MRIIYNTTFIVNEEAESDWVGFMKESYMSDLHAGNRCRDILFTRVSIDQPDGKSYSLQLVFETEAELNDFIENQLPPLAEKISAKYQNRYLCFSSILTEL